MKLCHIRWCAVAFMFFSVLWNQQVFGEEDYCDELEVPVNQWVNDEVDFCAQLKLLEDTRPDVELDGYIVDGNNDYFHVSTKNKAYISIKNRSLSFLESIENDTSVDLEIRQLFSHYKQVVCAYRQSKIPKEGIDMYKLADVLSIKVIEPESIKNKRKLSEYTLLYDSINCRSGSVCKSDNVENWKILNYFLSLSGVWTYFDVPLVDRVSRVIEKVQNIIPSKVLELGAGRGMLAQALINKGIELEAIDNFSYLYVDQCRFDKRCGNRIVKNRDAFENIEELNEFLIIMSFSGPPDSLVYEKYICEKKERVFLFFDTNNSRWNQNDDDYEHKISERIVLKENGDVHMVIVIGFKIGVKAAIKNSGSVIVITSKKIGKKMTDELDQELANRINRKIKRNDDKYINHFYKIAEKMTEIAQEMQSDYLESESYKIDRQY